MMEDIKEVVGAQRQGVREGFENRAPKESGGQMRIRGEGGGRRRATPAEAWRQEGATKQRLWNIS